LPIRPIERRCLAGRRRVLRRAGVAAPRGPGGPGGPGRTPASGRAGSVVPPAHLDRASGPAPPWIVVRTSVSVRTARAPERESQCPLPSEPRRDLNRLSIEPGNWPLVTLQICSGDVQHDTVDRHRTWPLEPQPRAPPRLERRTRSASAAATHSCVGDRLASRRRLRPIRARGHAADAVLSRSTAVTAASAMVLLDPR
jgi:hypothetical protein